MNELVLLTFLSFISPIFFAAYVFFRMRMVRSTKKDMSIDFYSRVRVIKITFIMLLILFCAFLFIYFIAYFILIRDGSLILNTHEFIFITAIIFASFIVAFGGGIYVSAILTEEYTLGKLKKYKEYSVLNVQVQLYHGPISHLFIYSGAVYVMLLISMLEFTNTMDNVDLATLFLYLIDGLIFGLMFFLGQIFNSTWKHQMFFIYGALCIYLILLIFGFVDFRHMPFNYFFFTFLIIAYSGLVLTYLHHKIYKTKYIYDSKIRIPRSLRELKSEISINQKQ